MRIVVLLVATALAACATVDVTKTAKGYHEPTNPNDIEILMTKSDRAYIELATVSTSKWSQSETAKMHNALRAKCAPLGANAVILVNSGVTPQGYLWSTGVAIRYK
jgi:uncharacterized protein (DUF2126 family)